MDKVTINRKLIPKKNRKKAQNKLKNWVALHKNQIIVIALTTGVVGIWAFYYATGLPKFDMANAVSVYGTIIQGMSALLAIVLAIIIFRIQSLENRNQTIEESTLDYIFAIINWSYPTWSKAVEEDIRTENITNRYIEMRCIGSPEFIKKEKEIQQRRLMNALNERTRIEKTIKKVRRDVVWNLLLLITPIFLSFYLIMISDSLDRSLGFYTLSLVILLSTFGIISLVTTVADSTTTSVNNEKSGEILKSKKDSEIETQKPKATLQKLKNRTTN